MVRESLLADAAPQSLHHQGTLLVALAGNPNTGKTTLFNSLTGLRHKVGNYPGVTVEKKMGAYRDGDGAVVDVLDLPGTYSLTARSPDEEIARRVVLGEMENVPRPDLVVAVVDATNIERNLFLAAQVFETGIPTLIALTMMDVAADEGIAVDVAALEKELGVPVVPVIATRSVGLAELKRRIAKSARHAARGRGWALEARIEREIAEVARRLRDRHLAPPESCDAEAIRLVGIEGTPQRIAARGGAEVDQAVSAARDALTRAGFESDTFETERRYGWLRPIAARCVRRAAGCRRTVSARVDGVLTHRVGGPALFLGLLAFIFQAIFAWATVPMGWIESLVGGIGSVVASLMPAGALQSLLVDGVVGGVGSVVVFLPQILFLFFFIGLMEDTGYMARVAFMMDRVMRNVGLHGKSCIPLLSSFACAVPGILATRTMENRRDRLVTILIAPLMSCSARLPIYTLFIAAFIPGSSLVKAGVMTGLYLLGVVVAIGVALVLKRTLARGESVPLVLELPPYRWPRLRTVMVQMGDRSRLFLKNAGTVILASSVILWALSYYPRPPQELAAAGASPVEHSFAGKIGHAMSPVLDPLGFDWRIGVGILLSFAAREVFVSAMGTIYNVDATGEGTGALAARLQSAVWESGPHLGQPIFTLSVAIALLVFYVLSCQCVSTLAVVRRETNSWRWPVFLFGYMTVLAYSGAWVAGRVTSLAGG